MAPSRPSGRSSTPTSSPTSARCHPSDAVRTPVPGRQKLQWSTATTDPPAAGIAYARGLRTGRTAEYLPALDRGPLCAWSLVGGLCVPKTSSTSGDQVVFVDQASDASPSSDAVLLKIDRFGYRFQRGSAVQGAVRPTLIVVGLVLAQDPPQMGLVPDEGAV